MTTSTIQSEEILVDCQQIWKIFGEQASAAMQAITSQGLSKRDILQKFGCTVGVSGVSLQVRRGEIFCIMGLSGSGKSTLIRLLNRLISPTQGRVLVKGKDLATLDAAGLRDMRAHHIGMVFQSVALLPQRTVLENTAFGLEVQGVPKEKRNKTAVILFSLGSVPAIIATIVYGIPPMLRLTTLAFKQIPNDLLELGRALGAPPRTILLKIEIPAAMPTLLVGLNQCILLSLAMVVLAGLVGSGGLGAEVTRGLTRMEMGLGLRAGLAIVAVALLLDRLSKAALGGKGKARA
ncbi:Vitamin B12 import ATP-binding protein BtuD [Castellaniella denitrificans]